MIGSSSNEAQAQTDGKVSFSVNVPNRLRSKSNRRHRICMVSDFFFPNMGGKWILSDLIRKIMKLVLDLSFHYCCKTTKHNHNVIKRRRDAHMVSFTMFDTKRTQSNSRYTLLWSATRDSLHDKWIKSLLSTSDCVLRPSYVPNPLFLLPIV